MMTEEELERHGIRIEIDSWRIPCPGRMPNLIEELTAYIVVNGERIYVDSSRAAWENNDEEILREEAIKEAQKYVKQESYRNVITPHLIGLNWRLPQKHQ